MTQQGRRQDNSQRYTQSYSKYFGQARVRTARLAFLLVLLVMSCWWFTSSGSSSQHALPEAAGDLPENNRIV